MSACSSSLNYEEGGENSILHGDAASEAFLSEIVGAQPWPGQRHWNMESIYEYGARAGFWRLHRMFTEAGVPVTVYGVATALARSPDQVAAMQEAGWEIASHGLKWIDYRDTPPEDERRHIDEAIRLHTEVTGERPLGWYTGRTSRQHRRLVAEEGGFDYVSDTYDDDLPYWLDMTGTARDRAAADHPLHARRQRHALRHAAGLQFRRPVLRLSQGQLRHALRRGRGGPAANDEHRPALPPGRPARPRGGAAALHRLRQRPRPGLAGAPHRHRPALARASSLRRAGAAALADGRETNSSRASAASSSIRPGSPSAPSRSSSGRRTTAPAACTMRSAAPSAPPPTTERLGVLNAHPDLAGKLAAAKRLTAESTAEQASAGPRCADRRRARAFYRAQRTPTPSVSASPSSSRCGASGKAEILAAFETRLGNDRATEFDTACRQVERIALLRLKELLPS